MSQKEESAIGRMEANQLTPEQVAAEIAGMGDKPCPEQLGALLDRIESVSDASRRLVLLTACAQSVKGKALKDLIQPYVTRAKKVIGKKRSPRGDSQYSGDGGDSTTDKRGPLVKVESQIPLPSWASKKGYANHSGRKYAFSRAEDGGFGDPIHTPLRLRSALTYPDRMIQGRELTRGILIEFENEKGEIKTLAFTRSEAATRAGREKLISDLSGAGVGFEARGIDLLQNAIMAGVSGELEGICFDYPGWREGVFVTPGGEAIGETNRDIGLASPLPGYLEHGEFDAWREAIAHAFCTELIEKAPHVPACVLFSLVSPLIDLAREEMSFILSIAKRTTGLKTFALYLMGSTWGNPLAEGTTGPVVTFNSTDNKLEDHVSERSGCGIAIDESTLLPNEKLGPLVYRFASGVEKSRQTNKRKERHWRLTVALTSEVPIQQLMREAGCEPPPGLMSRVLEIAATGERVSDAPVDAMRAAFQNYGHAGPCFVEAMIAGGWTREKITAAVAGYIRDLLGGRGEREQERRASRALGFMRLAGEIAREAGLIPAEFDVAAFVAGLWEQCKGATDTTATVIARVTGALASGLRDGSIPIYSDKGSVVATGGSGAALIQDFSFTENGQRRIEPVFVLPSATLAKIVGTRESVKDAAKILSEDGALLREQPDRLHWRGERISRAGIGAVKAYVLHARAVLGEEADSAIEEHRATRVAAKTLTIGDALASLAVSERVGAQITKH